MPTLTPDMFQFLEANPQNYKSSFPKVHLPLLREAVRLGLMKLSKPVEHMGFYDDEPHFEITSKGRLECNIYRNQALKSDSAQVEGKSP